MTHGGAVAPGLEGVLATTSAISSIMNGRLTYRGIDVRELVERSTFEETVYLLWHGELPGRAQLDEFLRAVAHFRRLPASIVEAMRTFPAASGAAAGLRAVLALQATHESSSRDADVGTRMRSATRTLAVFPTVVAARYRLASGHDPIAPASDLGYAANFLYMVRGRRADMIEERALDSAFILHAEHELNASTFAARVAASTLADVDSAVIAALCTLQGPLHGGAVEEVMRMLESVASSDRVDASMRDALDRGRTIAGFGHRVYRERDPRANSLRQLCRELAGAGAEARPYEAAVRIEELVHRERGIPSNVDFYAAALYLMLRIPRELSTAIFAMARVAGWIAHILEQYENNRLIRPRAEYVGSPPRPYVTIEER